MSQCNPLAATIIAPKCCCCGREEQTYVYQVSTSVSFCLGACIGIPISLA